MKTHIFYCFLIGVLLIAAVLLHSRALTIAVDDLNIAFYGLWEERDNLWRKAACVAAINLGEKLNLKLGTSIKQDGLNVTINYEVVE